MSGPAIDLRIKDPFGPAAAPAAYVPFAAAERALQAVDAVLQAGRVAVLVGPPGLGKTLLLHRVAVQQEQLEALYVPFCTLSLSEMCSLALRLFEWDVDSDPVISVAQHARSLHTQGSGLLLLIDDVGSMPEETAVGLAALFDLADGSLRIVMAADGIEQAAHVRAAFAPRLDCVPLDEGMSAEETRRYVTTRLDFVAADSALRAAFDPETIDALHRNSDGVPRRVNAAAQAIVRETLSEVLPTLRGAPPAVDPVLRPSGSTLSAMLAHEPDVREVIEVLRGGGVPAQAAAAATHSAEPRSAPDVGSTHDTSAEPTAPLPWARVGESIAPESGATTSSAGESSVPARTEPTPTVPTEAGAHATERETAATESSVGTYRMAKSGITERPREREKAHPARPATAAPGQDRTIATAFKQRPVAPSATAQPPARAKPAAEVVREAAVTPKKKTRRTKRRVLALIGAASIAAGFMWATIDPSAWQNPDAWSGLRATLARVTAAMFEVLPAEVEPTPIAEVPRDLSTTPSAVAPKPESKSAPIASRKPESRPESPPKDLAPEAARAVAAPEGESLAVVPESSEPVLDEPGMTASDVTSIAASAVAPDADVITETPVDTEASAALPESAPDAPAAVILVEGVTAAQEIADPRPLAAGPEIASGSAPTAAANATVAVPPTIEPIAVMTIDPPLESAAAAPPVAEPESIPEAPEIIGVGINAIPWAVIEVDGLELGETPLAGVGLPAGEHTFRARMPDGSIREQTVDIDASNRRVVFE